MPDNFLPALLKASWQGAVLVVVVLVLQRTMGPRLHPRWRYWLWALVAIRLAMPWSISSPVSVFNLLTLRGVTLFGLNNSKQQSQIEVPPKDATAMALAGTSPQGARSARWLTKGSRAVPWLLGLWGAGVMTLAGVVFMTQFRLARRVGRDRPLIDAAVMNLLEDCKQEMAVRVPVTVVESAAVGSPCLFGFVRPRLLLPKGMTESFSAAELRHVFLHELGHIKRWDILVGWLMTGLQILHWFNPLVWLAAHRMRVDRELACDALVLVHAREGENERYGQTIIKLLENFGRSAWAPNLAGAVENQNQMKERIRMIAKFRKSNRGLGLAVAMIVGVGLVTLTDARPDNSTETNLTGTWIMVGTPRNIGGTPAVGGRIKSLTDTHWSVTQTDPQSGATTFHHEGTWSVKGNEYFENVESANENTKELVGKTFKFTFKLENDTLTLTGVGNPWKEVWKRVKADTTKPAKLETPLLEGTWRGQEEGEAADTASLSVRGSSFEFRGAGGKEWYKATFTAYDTTPKQLVAVITDCPFSDYVGRTTYAIYDLKDGTLTLAGNEPGSLIVPAKLEGAGPGTRKFVFKHQ